MIQMLLATTSSIWQISASIKKVETLSTILTLRNQRWRSQFTTKNFFHSDFKGSKWTLTSLWKYFRSRGIDTDSIWTKSRYLLKNWLRMFQFFDLFKIINSYQHSKMFFCLVIDIVIKSILSAHEKLTSVFREQVVLITS